MAATTRSTRKTPAAKTDPTEAPAAPATADVAPLEPPTADDPTATSGAVTEQAAPATEDDTATEETPAPTVAAPQAPDVAPLEPPAVHAAPKPPAEPPHVSPTEVIPDVLSDIILDDATKEPPADPEAVFQPVTPYGSTLVCTVRLVERVYLGPHSTPVERLLQPRGAHVSESIAARIRERLVAQAAEADTEQ
ncbi:hypothetical protein ACIP9H_33705 [Streptomyces sp. NPDC088732]|uniref:hypothetical protein n=1 Tax=Streptomyces sp. NPDC088732 TaxID=3365879 RepID=UPI0038283FB1